MKVGIKSFSVDMDVKTNGIEFEVYENGEDGAFLGDLFVTKKGLVWCKGKTSKQNGKAVDWKAFIALMEAQ